VRIRCRGNVFTEPLPWNVRYLQSHRIATDLYATREYKDNEEILYYVWKRRSGRKFTIQPAVALLNEHNSETQNGVTAAENFMWILGNWSLSLKCINVSVWNMEGSYMEIIPLNGGWNSFKSGSCIRRAQLGLPETLAESAKVHEAFQRGLWKSIHRVSRELKIPGMTVQKILCHHLKQYASTGTKL
jgi:hypothetical protein